MIKLNLLFQMNWLHFTSTRFLSCSGEMDALLFWERKPATLREDLKNNKNSDIVHFFETPYIPIEWVT